MRAWKKASFASTGSHRAGRMVDLFRVGAMLGRLTCMRLFPYLFTHMTRPTPAVLHMHNAGDLLPLYALEGRHLDPFVVVCLICFQFP